LVYKKLQSETKTNNWRNYKKNSDHILKAIGTLLVTRTEATLAWDTMYIPAVAYPLVASHFQEKELNKLKNKALASFLPKMGFNWHTPRAVVYRPQECGGIGIKNLYVEQSVKQIKAYMQHTRMDSPLRHIIQISRNWVQLIVGIE
jgi:hypothetical protein